MATKQEHLNQILEGLDQTSREIKGTALISPDGMIIASSFKSTGSATDMAAAMGASILGLGARVTQSLNAGEMEEIIIRGEKDYVVVFTIRNKAVLLVQADGAITLGFLLLKARQSLKALTSIL